MRFAAIAVFALLLACASVAHAEITWWQCYNDNDGAINCQGTLSDTSGYSLTIAGTQFAGPGIPASGDMYSKFTTDSDADPLMTAYHSIYNDTGATWIGYDATVLLYSATPLSSYTLAGPTVLIPSDATWTTSLSSFTLTSTNSSDVAGQPYKYSGQITYAAGTPIADGDTLLFSYGESFAGSKHYTQHEILTPVYAVPEPGTLVLLGSGVLGFCGVWFSRRRRAK